MKRILKYTALLLCAAMMLAQLASAAVFSDMPEKDFWSYEALKSAADYGLLTGDNGRIMPFDNLTRAQMATILVRAYGQTQEADLSQYTDVPNDAWYYGNMAIAVNMGIFLGDGTGRLNPDNPITRQEVFIVLARALGAQEEQDPSVLDVFSDSADVADWALSGTAFMIGNEYIKGSDGQINPSSHITRQEFAQVMYNLITAGVISPGLSVEEKPDDEGAFGKLHFL